LDDRPSQTVRSEPRRNDDAVAAVAASIKEFGFRQPIVVDEAGVIIVGHTRWKAAQKLDLAKVPVHVATDLTPEQIRAYRNCRESGEQYKPSFGRGAAQQHRQWYNRPTRTGSVVKQLGEGYHLNKLRAEKLLLAEVDADHWKTWVHQRLSTPLDQTGAMTLFQTNPAEHLALAKHLTAERKTEEFVTGKGVVVKWERLRRQNHFLDALYNACAAGHYAGARLVEAPKPEKQRVSLAELAKRAAGR
jgi:hypothetical protein